MLGGGNIMYGSMQSVRSPGTHIKKTLWFPHALLTFTYLSPSSTRASRPSRHGSRAVTPNYREKQDDDKAKCIIKASCA